MKLPEFRSVLIAAQRPPVSAVGFSITMTVRSGAKPAEAQFALFSQLIPVTATQGLVAHCAPLRLRHPTAQAVLLNVCDAPPALQWRATVSAPTSMF
ncbi:MAG TPA: hypothetical protein VEK79_01285 [Thermoanaerobaculia bacterium]|nr:hypothetical protein [Thermoanaerobaculia bacterium]